MAADTITAVAVPADELAQLRAQNAELQRQFELQGAELAGEVRKREEAERRASQSESARGELATRYGRLAASYERAKAGLVQAVDCIRQQLAIVSQAIGSDV
jgi:hypothetical protein